MSKATEEDLFDDDLLACRLSPQDLAAAIVDAQDNGIDAWQGNIISMMQAVFGAVLKSGGHCGICYRWLEQGKPPAQVGLVMHSSGQAFGIPLCEDCATADDASFSQSGQAPHRYRPAERKDHAAIRVKGRLAPSF